MRESDGSGARIERLQEARRGVRRYRSGVSSRHMRLLLKKFLPLVILLVAVAAISITALWLTGRKAPRQAVATQESAAPDSLKIVLTPVKGESKLDAQIAELQARIKGAPDEVQHLERLGWMFVAKARVSGDPGYYSLAEQTAKAMMNVTPDDPAAALLLGHTYHAQHRFSDAEAIARQLTSRREFVFDHALLGDVLMEQGKLTEATEAYQKMVDLKPSLQTYSRVAHMRWLKGDLDGAIGASRLAVGAGSPRDSEPLSWAYTRLASYELQKGNASSAVADTDRALQLLPAYAPALAMRGRILLAEGKAEEAVEPLRRAVEASPLPDNLWLLADALRASGDIPAAEAVEVQLARTGAIDDPRTYSLFLASRGKDAARALQFAVAEMSARQDIFTYDALAWAQMASGQVEKARENIGRALAEGTQDGRLFYHAGAIAAAAGADAEALELFKKARDLEMMLLPSERQALDQAFTALVAGTAQQLSSNQPYSRENRAE